MLVPDTNLLIYAYDETSPHHAQARRWWEDALSRREPIGVTWVFARFPSLNWQNPLAARH